jgi:DNA-binding NtrC family response regulator
MASPVLVLEKDRSSLMQCLTDQIIEGRLTVYEARQIVLRREFYKQHPIGMEHRPENMDELDRVEVQMILRVVRQCDGVMAQAATKLKMPKTTLYKKLRRIGYEV